VAPCIRDKDELTRARCKGCANLAPPIRHGPMSLRRGSAARIVQDSWESGHLVVSFAGGASAFVIGMVRKNAFS
jgi:MoaA/NifB/PqqE/SkfB family radical SAM enzyme